MRGDKSTGPVQLCSPLRVKPPSKRKPDLMELQAEIILKKIKTKGPHIASKLKPNKGPSPPRNSKREICTQSKAWCNAIETEYGTDLPPKSVLNSDEYDKKLE
jgi:hypothetical protein